MPNPDSNSNAIPPQSIPSVPPPPAARSALGGHSAAIPPPPPPRSTLPPVRPPAQPTTGVGSAKGVRWKGELGNVASQPSRPQPAGQTSQNGAATAGEAREEDVVTRTAPPWLVSMVMHLVLLLVLALISTPVGAELGDVILDFSQGKRDAPVELAEFSIDAAEVIADSDDLSESMVDVDLSEVFETTSLSDAEELVPVEFGASSMATIARPMFSGRSGAMKEALLAIYGGTPETQEAVKLGLEWLKRNQRKNGSWSMQGPYSDGAFTQNETAATSMALLAFLGDGHTHMKGDYKEVVESGIKFLVGKQDRSGFFAKAARGHEKMYAQAQATIAVCELYGMTKDSWLRPKAQLAIDFAEKSQSPEGGWRYEPNFDSDTSVTGWFVMGLESGRSAGLQVDISKILKVNDYLDTASSFEDAAYSYQANGSPTAAMTAEGLLCRQYISWERTHPPLKQGIKALLERPVDMSNRDVYYWYYATQVIHHYGGSPWRQWNEIMREELPAAQVRGGREDGSWAPQMDRWGQNSGRLFTTCLSLYCLEVYYRHMPLYQADGKQFD